MVIVMRHISKIVVFMLSLVTVTAAYAADVKAVCKLGSDKRTVSVAFTNPNPQKMACEVNCDMAIAGGFGTVACVKEVPGNATDLVLCTEVSRISTNYSGVKGVETSCRDPDTAANAPGDLEKHEDASDEDAELMMRRAQEQARELMKRLKQN